jgi:hypothetical protein
MGSALDFVQYPPVPHLAKESARIELSRPADVRILQRSVLPSGEGRLYEGGLARLPGTEDGHHRIFAGCLQQFPSKVSLYHASKISALCDYFKSNLNISHHAPTFGQIEAEKEQA